jgi:lactoylglutathione lyase
MATMRIAHIAVRVDDVQEAIDFYEGILGFKGVCSAHNRDHCSCHLTDGFIDLSIRQYDTVTQSAESQAAGEKRCIQ